MSSRKANDASEEAEMAEGRPTKANGRERRKAPFYKVMQGMPIAVDAFCYGVIPGVTSYFLTYVRLVIITTRYAHHLTGMHIRTIIRAFRPLGTQDRYTAPVSSGGSLVILFKSNCFP